jgi:LAO/AO transport system kinase
MHQTIEEKLKKNFYHNAEIRKMLIELELKVVKSEVSSFSAANFLLDHYFNRK